MAVVALAGGVGAARFLRGLLGVLPERELSVVVNTGDDHEFYGVHVSPDLDIISYTLANLVNEDKGYGLRGDRFEIIETLARHGHETWFRLGDRDFATSLHRTLRLRAGAGLAEVSEEIRRALGLGLRVLPMSEAPCPTIVTLRGGRRVHFEAYLARDGAPDEVSGVDLSAAAAATAAPGVLEALTQADTVLVCPSNPVVSIGPILEVQGVREAIRASRAAVVGVSPIIAGAPVKGPADRLLRGIGVEVSAPGVAGFYRDLLHGFVIDERDRALRERVESMGLRCRVTDTLMRKSGVATALARETLAFARELGRRR